MRSSSLNKAFLLVSGSAPVLRNERATRHVRVRAARARRRRQLTFDRHGSINGGRRAIDNLSLTFADRITDGMRMERSCRGQLMLFVNIVRHWAWGGGAITLTPGARRERLKLKRRHWALARTVASTIDDPQSALRTEDRRSNSYEPACRCKRLDVQRLAIRPPHDHALLPNAEQDWGAPPFNDMLCGAKRTADGPH